MRTSCSHRKTCIIFCFLSLAFIVALLLRTSNRIPAISFPHSSEHHNFSDSKLNSDELFTDFNNETGVVEAIVPDIVHFVLFGDAGQLDFTTFLCILAAIKVHTPSILYLHTDAPLYAGSHSKNRYWLVLHDASRKLNVSIQERHFPRPTHVFGQRLSSIWHASDVSRIHLLQKHGGIVLDKDQLILKPLHEFRHFEMVVGWPDEQFIGTQLLIAHPKARLLKPWLEGYRRYRPAMWYYNAAQLPTQNLLTKHPELVHREKWRFGVQNLAVRIYGQEPWPQWRDYHALHLLTRHKYLLRSQGKDFIAPEKDDLDEFLIQSYSSPLGEMSRFILHELSPKLPHPSLWPGTH